MNEETVNNILGCLLVIVLVVCAILALALVIGALVWGTATVWTWALDAIREFGSVKGEVISWTV